MSELKLMSNRMRKLVMAHGEKCAECEAGECDPDYGSDLEYIALSDAIWELEQQVKAYRLLLGSQLTEAKQPKPEAKPEARFVWVRDFIAPIDDIYEITPYKSGRVMICFKSQRMSNGNRITLEGDRAARFLEAIQPYTVGGKK